ncbi:hypothetical protein M9H77_20149 [Catharanthus roseus]|uniref:Uncharacterized protein n=1 Tax=Catharanthus roseus TaxID=4058 RepID=A0ACC0AMV9_CATRO|nr:hypothetical protein M9H77_20149 [Catharanthus roseus]
MSTTAVSAEFRRKRSRVDPSSEQQFGGSSSSLPEEMIFEILTRLPVKTLMRFKSVSKSWNSIITHSSFADAHRSRSPSPNRAVVIMDPDPSLTFAGRESPSHFFYADLNKVYKKKGSSTVDVSLHLSVPENLKYFGVTNTVNGLVCFYKRNVSKMLNIATREIVDLPDSNYAYKHCVYHLGFDPADKSYKLLKICPVYEDFDEDDDEEDDAEAFEEREILPIRNMECEILTLGKDNSWRIIPPPPCPIRRHCLCVKDGFLYWKFIFNLRIPKNSGIDRKRFFIAFNLATERFQNLPNLSPKHLALNLPNFGTNLALVRQKSVFAYGRRRTEWLISSHFNQESGLWSKINRYMLPFDHDCRIGILPEGKVLMYSSFPRMMFLIDDHKKKKGERVAVEKIFINHVGGIRIGLCRLCLYEENLISLKHLINNM